MTSLPPPLDEQLVLELEAGVTVDETVRVFPSGRCSGLTLPMNQERADSSGEARASDLFRLGDGSTVVDRRKGWWSGGRRAHELLQEANMEHIVETRTWWQLQAVCHIVDDGGDTVGPVEPRLELPRSRHLQ
jgi:hypothetical protein